MAILDVALDLVAEHRSIRCVIDGGEPTYFSESEVRERLEELTRIEPEQVDRVLEDVNAGRGHVLRFEGAGPERESYLRELWTGELRRYGNP